MCQKRWKSLTVRMHGVRDKHLFYLFYSLFLKCNRKQKARLTPTEDYNSEDSFFIFYRQELESKNQRV